MRRLPSFAPPLSPPRLSAALPADAPERFAFGANWTRFLALVDEGRIHQAEMSLRALLGLEDLSGRSFLDIGSGSGLFSLAARRLGARVHSFDYDPLSVACAEELRRRYRPQDAGWQIERRSVLQPGLAAALGSFDIVYSWGVLHHTGAMWPALDQAAGLVKPGGRLAIALYNDQRAISRYWSIVKQLYVRQPWLRPALVGLHAPYLVGLRWLVRRLRGQSAEARGMALWTDLIDWLGGWPFEVAAPAQVNDFFVQRGFRLLGQTFVGRRHGCNEFVFVKEGRRE